MARRSSDIAPAPEQQPAPSLVDDLGLDDANEDARIAAADSDRPRARDVDQAPDTPEAREKALKQEIVELMLKPLVEQRIKAQEALMEQGKKDLIQLQELARSFEVFRYQSSESEQAKRTLKTALESFFSRNSSLKKPDATWLPQEADLTKYVMDGFAKREKEIESERLAVTFEQDLLASVFEEGEQDATGKRKPFDENALRDAFVDLRGFLISIRDAAAKNEIFSNQKVQPTLANPLANRILGTFVAFAPELSGDALTNVPFPLKRLSAAEQLVGASRFETSRFDDRSLYGLPAETLRRSAEFGFIQSKLPGGYAQKEANAYKRVFSIGRGIRAGIDSQEPLREKDALVASSLLSGEGARINARLAYDYVAKDVKPEENLSVLMGDLGKAGWTRSKSGGVVEPGQENRKADAVLLAKIEEFSKPQEKEDVAYTYRQAMDKLHRAVAERNQIEADAVSRAAQAEARIQKLEKEIDDRQMSAELNTKEFGRRVSEAEKATTLLRGELAKRDAEIVRLQADARARERDARELQTTLEGHVISLSKVLEEKTGFFGGDKRKLEGVRGLMTKLADWLNAKKKTARE
ncbi:hypothetical protein HYV73_02705 [Candidatus Uhrbacteria bacterium]|nr:hypothetical protein [Candidatus Uhrbacteria bacterium]